MNSVEDRKLLIEKELGSGRCFVLLYDENRHNLFANQLSERLAESSRVVLLRAPTVGAENWPQLVGQLEGLLAELKVRQASFVGFGGGASIAQALSLDDAKLVRTLALIDASSRPHPSRFSRWVDAVERWMPLGLPLRSIGAEFDSRPFLQRIRCPALVATTPIASAYEKSDADVIADLLPTAWRIGLGNEASESAVADLCNALVLFQEVPAKCPQKNLSAIADIAS